MPDRCTPEYERMLAEFGALLPYRQRGSQLVGDLLPGRRSPGTIDFPSASDVAGRRQAGVRGPRNANANANASATAGRREDDRAVRRLRSRARVMRSYRGMDVRGVRCASQQ